MIGFAEVVRLDENLKAALDASNQLLAEALRPAEEGEPSGAERFVLLLLSNSGQVAEKGIAERLHTEVDSLARPLGLLESKGLIARTGAGSSAAVALTDQGARMHDYIASVSRERFDGLKPDIEALRDLLLRILHAAEGEAGE